MNARLLKHCSACFYLLLGVLLTYSGGAVACSTHGTRLGDNTEGWLTVRSATSQSGSSRVTIALASELVEPGAPTICVCALGLGDTELTAPRDLDVLEARLEVVNLATGKSRVIPEFVFVRDPETTEGFAAGSPESGIVPLFQDALWFGFASLVDPFVLTLGEDESVRMVFEIELPTSRLPLLLKAQVGAGEGMPDGSPVFEGDHPVSYFSSETGAVQLQEIGRVFRDDFEPAPGS